MTPGRSPHEIAARRRLVAALAIVLLAGACGPTTPPPSAAPSASPTPAARPTTGPSPTGSPAALTWRPAGLAERTELAVPLDYAYPAAGTITLAIARRPAADQAERIGVLLVNPGGPGGSGLGIAGATDLSTSIPQAILDRFDVVSWDPRGIGQSSGLTCPGPATITRVQTLDPDPRTAAGLAAYGAAFDAAAAECQAASADLLPHLAEADTARDMDAIRVALGEATVSYLGWSYGTYLGYLYATLFPSHLRAAVLDGPVNPTLDLVGRDASQARGFERTFDHFLALCAAATRCPFHGGDDPAAAYDALIAHLERSPQGSYLDAGQAVLGALTWLYGRDYPGLATALSNAEQGDGTMLRQAADAYFSGAPLGSYEATLCLDVPRPSSTTTIAAALAAGRRDAPRFGPLIILADQYGCLHWPQPAPAAVPLPPPPEGLPPVLVVAGTWDPATPPWDAPALAKALGGGVVLTRDGLGHTSGSSASTDPCLRDALVAYLVGLHAPPVGTVCTDGPAFSWP